MQLVSSTKAIGEFLCTIMMFPRSFYSLDRISRTDLKMVFLGAQASCLPVGKPPAFPGLQLKEF
jgi:hypothetical protein